MVCHRMRPSTGQPYVRKCDNAYLRYVYIKYTVLILFKMYLLYSMYTSIHLQMGHKRTGGVKQ